MGMEKTLIWMLVIMMLSALVAGQWNSKLTFFGTDKTVKDIVGYALDPSFGKLLDWNLYIGFFLIVLIITFLQTLVQKYFTDQAALKEIKKEQKILQEEMKKYKDHPEKLLELQQKQLEFIPKTMNLTMKPLMFTLIPVIFLFRWFGDNLRPHWGGWWILYYIILAMIISGILRKQMDVA